MTHSYRHYRVAARHQNNQSSSNNCLDKLSKDPAKLAFLAAIGGFLLGKLMSCNK